MGEWLQDYFNQLKEIWGNLNNQARIIIGIGVIAVIAALGFLILWGGGGNFQPLFTDLTTEDANAIVNRLEENGVSYKLADQGTTILVPSNEVHQTRLDMAGAGLPDQGVVGFEVFDQSQFGTTDFERKVNFYRAVGGELSRSIQAMDIIEYAKVQITAPEESLFAEEEKPATASVLVDLRPGVSVKEAQVKSISNLVASGVQGLTPGNVTVVDTAGNLLSATEDGDGSFDSGDQYEMRRKLEAGLQSDLRRMLTKVVGPDNFSVQVQARVNFDRREVESKTYSPVTDDEGIVRSQEEEEETYEGTGAAGGAPGTEANLPQYQQEEDQETAGEYERTSSVTNYEINEKLERHVYAPGEVERLSVSVIVDDGLDQATVQTIEDSVEAAIGFNPERGDVVNISSINFDRSVEEELAQAREAEEAARRRQMYIYAGLIVIVLITILILFRIVRGARREQEYAPGEGVDYTVGGEYAQQAEEAAAEEELSEEEKRRRQLKEDLEDLVTDQPEDVAEVLKSWLME